MEYTLPLPDPRATLETVGGKGASLARLSIAGLPVPGGFHITTEAYRQFVAANELQPAILTELEKVEGSAPSTLDTISEAISRRFRQGKMPGAIVRAITQAYANLSGADPAVAVRSSATAEDLPDLSFAGLQETYLNIQGIEALLAAVQRCWASLWTARAVSYRSQHHIYQETVSMAVVVQYLVLAEASGILFTVNPVNGQRDQAMISATWGLGEAVVGGLVTPDTMVVEKSTSLVLTRLTADKQVMTVRVDGGTEEQPIPEAKRRVPVLDDQAARELVRLGAQIEQFYNLPMDVEWALAQGKFAILQARPITVLPESQVQPPIQWKLPEPNGQYMRGSIIEQLPEPLTPLFATLGGSIIDAATRNLFAQFIGAKEFKVRLFVTINDYGYLNLNFGKWAMILGSVVMLFRLRWVFQQAEARWQQAHHHYLDIIQHWQSKPLGDYRAAELITGVRELTGDTMRMYTVLQTGPIPSASSSEIMFTQTYNHLIKKKGDPEAPVFVMGFESMPIRAELALYDLADWARPHDNLAAHLVATPAAQLAEELGNTNAPAGVDSEDWAEWQRRFQAHLASYGHFTYDLDFSKAVAADDPTPLLETCRMYLFDKVGNPHARVQEIARRRDQAASDLLIRLHGLKRWLFHKQMHSAQKYAPLREDGLSDLGLGYPLLRRMLRELGRRLVLAGAILQPEDVFWLYERELEQAVVALDQRQPISSMMKPIQDRRVVWKTEQKVAAPMALPIGSKFLGIDLEKISSGGTSDEVNVIKGFGVSQGKVTAPARVLLGPEDFDQMHLGDVLVAPITTPAWTPLFALASAIVTDIGGPLSHSSIVAREYGIPAVLGTASATRRIQSGQMITVDGNAGTVMLG